ncbi:MAG TPA: FAD-dependent oxidoreductase [Chitinophagaceae bacterium]
MKITIVGGGIIGLCCAYYLQKEGNDVTVIDSGDITDGTSFGNAGYISPSHFTPLASPGAIAKGLRWMMSSTSPFYIKPRLNMDLFKWAITFWKNSNEKTMEKNIPHLNNILQLSRELTVNMKHELGDSFRMKEDGCFMLYKKAATEIHEIELARQAATHGLEAHVMSREEVQAMEPELEVNIRGGVLYPVDCHLHPGDFIRTLKKHLIVSGVKLQLNTTVTNFEKKGNQITAVLTSQGRFECDELIIASGCWSPLVASRLGIKILMQAGKGYSMTFENVSKNIHRPAILVDNRVAMTPMGPDLRLGGTMEINSPGSPLLIKRAKAIFDAAKLYYPGLPISFPATEKIWSGLRPLSPDGLPYIGRHSKYKNLVIASGHAMLGLSLSAATGKLVEEIVTDKKTTIPMQAFSVERYS